MHQIVLLVESFQRFVQLEKVKFLGIGLDRYVHFGLIFSVALTLFYLNRPKWAVGVSAFLIITKEVLDLSVLAFYGPIANQQYLDSTLDVSVGFFGLLWAYQSLKLYGRIYER